jgi:hypothetical protein
VTSRKAVTSTSARGAPPPASGSPTPTPISRSRRTRGRHGRPSCAESRARACGCAERRTCRRHPERHPAARPLDGRCADADHVGSLKSSPNCEPHSSFSAQSISTMISRRSSDPEDADDDDPEPDDCTPGRSSATATMATATWTDLPRRPVRGVPRRVLCRVRQRVLRPRRGLQQLPVRLRRLCRVRRRHVPHRRRRGLHQLPDRLCRLRALRRRPVRLHRGLLWLRSRLRRVPVLVRRCDVRRRRGLRNVYRGLRRV